MDEPKGTQYSAKEQLRKTSEEWAEKLSKSGVKGKDAWYTMNSTIMKTLQYPLLVTSFTEEECDWIMAPILNKGLSVAHICNKIDR